MRDGGFRPTISTVDPSPAIPPDTVLAAFGVAEEPVALPGGKGGTWRVGGLVVKPVEHLAETLWRAEVLANLPDSARFRIARPIRTIDGAWTIQGWEACHLVAGEPNPHRPDDALRAGISFHEALVDLSRPDFLDSRHDPWSIGDRIAWEELPVDACPSALELLRPLVEARRPVAYRAQVVHGDLLGNVLFADGLPPAIIDWPPYWRPASWAAAVVVADALCWFGAAPTLAARWSHLPDWGQMLLRALIFRIATDEAAIGPTGWTPHRIAAYRPVVDLAVAHSDCYR